MTPEVRDEVCRQIAGLCAGWALYFCQAEAVTDWRSAAERGGQKYKRAMVWIKPDGMPQFTGDRPGMGIAVARRDPRVYDQAAGLVGTIGGAA